MLMANVCVLLLSNARPLFINPPTKESGTILKFGTLSSHNANNAASRSASITSERSRTVLGLSRFDQFLERVQTFDIHPSIHTQHRGIFLAQEPFNPKGHWHLSRAEA
jgi:hypothetical protein